MTEHEFEHLAADLKQIVETDLVYFLELDGEPVAFSISIPNLNQALKHVPSGRLFPLGLPKLLTYAKLGAVYELRMPLMGVLPAYRGRGFDAVVIDATIRNGLAAGYDACELSWVLDTNTPLVNSLDKLGAVPRQGVRDAGDEAVAAGSSSQVFRPRPLLLPHLTDDPDSPCFRLLRPRRHAPRPPRRRAGRPRRLLPDVRALRRARAPRRAGELTTPTTPRCGGSTRRARSGATTCSGSASNGSATPLALDLEPAVLGEAYLARYAAHWQWTPGAEAAFHAIAARVPVGLLTNGFADAQHAKLDRFPALRERAAAVVISEEVGVMKPHPGDLRARDRGGRRRAGRDPSTSATRCTPTSRAVSPPAGRSRGSGATRIGTTCSPSTRGRRSWTAS